MKISAFSPSKKYVLVLFYVLVTSFSFACHNSTINSVTSVLNGDGTRTFTISVTIDVGTDDGYSMGFALQFTNATATQPVVQSFTPAQLTRAGYDPLIGHTGATIGSENASSYFLSRYGGSTNVVTYEASDNTWGFGSTDYTKSIDVTVSGCVQTITLDADIRNLTATANPNSQCVKTFATGLTCCTNPTGTISGTPTICAGENTNLSVALTGTAPWSLTYSNGSTPTTVNGILTSPYTVSVSPTTTTNYTLTAISDATTCAGTYSGTASVTVNTKPTGTISGTPTICTGGNTNLSVALTGTAPWSLTYSNGTAPTTVNGISTSPYSIAVSPTTTTNYTLTAISDATTCAGTYSGTASVTTNICCTNPTGTISGTQTICVGGNTNLSVALTGTAPWSLTYSNGTAPTTINGISTSPYTISVSPATTTNYTLTAISDATTCAGIYSGTASVTVNTKPTGTISGTPTICTGGNTTLSVALTGTPPWSLTYSNGTAPTTVNGISTSPYSIAVSPATTTNYTLTAISDATTCTGTYSGNASVTVNTNPTGTISGTQTICVGGNTNLSVALTGTAPWSLTYSNGTAPTTVNGILTSPYEVSVSPTTTTNYTLTAINDATTCAGTYSGTASVIVNIVPVLIITNPAVVCRPLKIDLTDPAITAGSTAGSQITYWLNNLATSPLTFASTVGTDGTYYIKSTLGGCSTIQPVTVTIKPRAVADFTPSKNEVSNFNTAVSFTNQSSDATNYSWTFGDGSGTVQTNPSHIFPDTIASTYEVTLVANNIYDCPDTLIKTITVYEELLLFIPNTFTPDDNKFNQIFKPVITAGFMTENYNFIVFNRWGEIVFETKDIKEGWDGTTVKGELSQEGTYTWQIFITESRYAKRKVLTGHVNILR